MRIKDILIGLRSGNLNIALDNKYDIYQAIQFIFSQIRSNQIVNHLDLLLDIITIGNIVYNNSDLDDDEQPIENGVYDILVEQYGMYRTSPVGGEVVIFENRKPKIDPNKFRSPMVKIDPIKEDLLFDKELLYKNQMTKYHYYYYDMPHHPVGFLPIGDGRLNTKHEHPNLVGTIRKAKFVLTSQAEEKGVANDDNVVILERDFFGDHFQKNIILGGQILRGIISLKYDGLSVEATLKSVKIGDIYKVIIVSARTRGDVLDSNAKDITHILYGYEFYNADPNLFMSKLGVKFEAVMTYQGLNSYNIERQANYKNPRSAISSIINNHKGYMYLKYVVLVPLETEIEKEDSLSRLAEVEFMNTYLTTGEYFRYAYIEGDYVSTLFQINKFTQEAELCRSNLPIMYDGVVFEYTDIEIRNALGRKNAVNLYALAIKFNPLKKQTVFRGYKYTIGVNGSVTPIIYYDPIEFYGGIHDHSTGSSFKRFNDLNLAIGDILNVEYTNDVMPYVTKAVVENNFNNPNVPEKFITVCPFCGNKLTLSKSNKTVIDNNPNCPERIRSKMVNMIERLDLKDFAEASFEKLSFNTFKQMIEAKYDDVSILGKENALKFLNRMNDLRTNPIADFKFMGALGFTNIAVETWKLILSYYSIHDLILIYDKNIEGELKTLLVEIKGIGPIKAETIESEFGLFYDDIIYISKLNNLIISKGMKKKRKLVITGFRNDDIINTLISYGFEVSENAVTKDTYALLVPQYGFISSKTKNAMKYGIQIVEINQFIDNIKSYL